MDLSVIHQNILTDIPLHDFQSESTPPFPLAPRLGWAGQHSLFFREENQPWERLIHSGQLSSSWPRDLVTTLTTVAFFQWLILFPPKREIRRFVLYNNINASYKHLLILEEIQYDYGNCQ